MSDLNQCNFIGRLGDNPQIRQTQTGEPMATFSIAVSEKWNDKQGNRQEKTEWVNIQAFGKLAEIMGQYLQKGSQVFISGKLQSRKYTGQDGVERTAVSILVNQMQMLGSRTDGGQAPQAHNGYPQQHQAPPQGQQYQTINGHPTTTPVGQPMPVTPPMGHGGQVPDEDMPF